MAESDLVDILPIQIVNRTGTGRRDRFDQSPVTFGREATCQIVLAGRFVSRRHGQLQFEKGRWRLTPLSANGAEVNGKRVSKKGRDLRDQDQVSIGGEDMFQVRIGFGAVAPVEADTDDDQEEQQEAPPPRKRRRLWIGIGIYLVAMTALFIFLGTLKTSKKLNVGDVPELTRAQIRSELAGAIQPMERNERDSREALQDARERMERLYASPDQMYKAFQSYRLALALSGKRNFDDSMDERRYLNLRELLEERVHSLYNDAYEKLRSGRYGEAARAFEQLTHVFPAPSSKIHRNIEAQRSIAVANAGKKQRRRR